MGSSLSMDISSLSEYKMSNWSITRKYKTTVYVFGQITNGDYICFTLERPDLNNQPDVSCIPTGTYTCKRGMHRLYGMTEDFETFEVLNVPNRDKILFHSGNLPSDSKGCILLGTEEGMMHTQFAILNSRVAFRQFMAQNEGVDTFELVISE